MNGSRTLRPRRAARGGRLAQQGGTWFRGHLFRCHVGADRARSGRAPAIWREQVGRADRFGRVSNPDPTAHRSIQVHARLAPAEAAAVDDLVRRADQVDGASALNEQALLRLGDPGGDAVRHLLGTAGADQLVAYAQLDGTAGGDLAAECVVAPDHRRAGWGSAMVARLFDEAGGSAVRVWSHGGHPGAARLAARAGFDRVRELWQLQRPLGGDAPALPAFQLPGGVAVRTFVVDQDESAWLDLNARAFAAHPEQGSLDVDDLAQRLGSDWFDPGGFFLAERLGGPDGDRLVGFHWTKVVPADGGRVGEVYVLGVDPVEQGSGLGSALTLVGLQHLAQQAVRAVLLYVEADNAAALRVYQRLGFAHIGTDTQYRHPAIEQPATAVGTRGT